jgi:hypothetical protein
MTTYTATPAEDGKSTFITEGDSSGPTVFICVGKHHADAARKLLRALRFDERTHGEIGLAGAKAKE